MLQGGRLWLLFAPMGLTTIWSNQSPLTPWVGLWRRHCLKTSCLDAEELKAYLIQERAELLTDHDLMTKLSCQTEPKESAGDTPWGRYMELEWVMFKGSVAIGLVSACCDATQQSTGEHHWWRKPSRGHWPRTPESADRYRDQGCCSFCGHRAKNTVWEEVGDVSPPQRVSGKPQSLAHAVFIRGAEMMLGSGRNTSWAPEHEQHALCGRL